MARCKDDGIPYEVESPFCNVRTNITVRQSKSLERRGSFGSKLKELFSERDDTGTFIVPELNVRPQVLSIKDHRNGVGKPVFKLAPLGNEQLFDLTAPDLRVPGIPDDALRQVICQASQLA